MSSILPIYDINIIRVCLAEERSEQIHNTLTLSKMIRPETKLCTSVQSESIACWLLIESKEMTLANTQY